MLDHISSNGSIFNLSNFVHEQDQSRLCLEHIFDVLLRKNLSLFGIVAIVFALHGELGDSPMELRFYLIVHEC